MYASRRVEQIREIVRDSGVLSDAISVETESLEDPEFARSACEEVLTIRSRERITAIFSTHAPCVLATVSWGRSRPKVKKKEHGNVDAER